MEEALDSERHFTSLMGVDDEAGRSAEVVSNWLGVDEVIIENVAGTSDHRSRDEDTHRVRHLENINKNGDRSEGRDICFVKHVLELHRTGVLSRSDFAFVRVRTDRAFWNDRRFPAARACALCARATTRPMLAGAPVMFRTPLGESSLHCRIHCGVRKQHRFVPHNSRRKKCPTLASLWMRWIRQR